MREGVSEKRGPGQVGRAAGLERVAGGCGSLLSCSDEEPLPSSCHLPFLTCGHKAEETQ